jgi:hypothetical protein
MRAFGALLWLVTLGFCGYNWWQIRELKSELASQRAAVRVSERSPGVLLKLEQALQHGERARKLLEQGRHRDARRELDKALGEFSSASRDVDESTASRLRQIEESLAKVREQTQGLLRRVTPGEKRAEGG